MAIATGFFITQIVTTVVMVFVSALMLMISTKIFKLKDTSYKTALWVAGIIVIVNFVITLLLAISSPPIALLSILFNVVVVGILLAIYLVKIKYQLEWGKAALVWLVWFVLSMVAGIIVGIILGIIFVAIGLGAGLVGL